jgi:hypothetical protein
MPQQQWQPPAPPDEPVQEGARWRWHKPPSEAVATWFGQQHIADELDHEHYVGGVVLIPQSEKVKYTKPDGSGTIERQEQVFTPYVQIGTRIAYFHDLAEARNLIPVIEPADVPRATNPQSLYFNANMEAGLWWHVVAGRNQGDGNQRFLCATWTVALYKPESYARKLNGHKEMPVRQGRGTKQVWGSADINQIAKAQTGAIGRALGVCGILVVGTGIATAEDMQEYVGAPPQQPVQGEPQLPVPTEVPGAEAPPLDPEAALDQLRAHAMTLQAQMQERGVWPEFSAWYSERAKESGWSSLNDVPHDALRGVVSRMERMVAEAPASVPNEQTQVAPLEEVASEPVQQ